MRIMNYPTKWPLFEFWLGIWKLKVVVTLFRPSIESLSYEYHILMVHWGSKQLLRVRLYDSEQRMRDRLDPLLGAGKSIYTKKELKDVIKIAREELKKAQ